MEHFKIGQSVYWHDPAGETSGIYEIYDTYEEKYDNITDTDIDDRIILIGNGYSEAEVFAHELKIFDRDEKD